MRVALFVPCYVNALYPEDIDNEELNALLTTIKNQGEEIEALIAELEKLKAAAPAVEEKPKKAPAKKPAVKKAPAKKKEEPKAE